VSYFDSGFNILERNCTVRDAIGIVVLALLGLVAVVFLNGAVSPHDFRRPVRFGLRTMLIATALVAVVMGLAIYALK
jgi:hypothetical protein